VGKAKLSSVFHTQSHGLPLVDSDERSIVRAPNLARKGLRPQMPFFHRSGLDLLLDQGEMIFHGNLFAAFGRDKAGALQALDHSPAVSN